jgi:hypothetical protein
MRYGSHDAIVLADFVRPDEISSLLFNCKEIASPIGETNCVTSHGRRGRNITTSCDHPFWAQVVDVGRTDFMFCRLTPGVA